MRLIYLRTGPKALRWVRAVSSRSILGERCCDKLNQMGDRVRASEWWDGTSKNPALQQRSRLWSGSALKELSRLGMPSWSNGNVGNHRALLSDD
jgi:hypothetical protein